MASVSCHFRKLSTSLACEWKAKSDNSDRNHGICGQLQGRFWCTNMVTVLVRLLRPPRSVDTSQHIVPRDTDLCRLWHNHSSL